MAVLGQYDLALHDEGIFRVFFNDRSVVGFSAGRFLHNKLYSVYSRMYQHKFFDVIDFNTAYTCTTRNQVIKSSDELSQES